MQASVQDLSTMLGSLIQGGTPGAASLGQSQAIGTDGKTGGGDFLASLESSLKALIQGDQSSAIPMDPAQLMAAIEQYLQGQNGLPGGNGLPSATDGVATDGSATDGTATDLRELLAQLQTALANAPASGDPAAAMQQVNGARSDAAMGAVVLKPVAADGVAQAALDQRRLFERFQSLPEMRQSTGDIPADVLRQAMGKLGDQSHQSHAQSLGADGQTDTSWLGNGKGALALNSTMQGSDFTQQLAKMIDMKNSDISAKDGATLGNLIKGDMPDLSALSSAMMQRHGSTPVAGGDNRPATAAATPSFIHVPLHDSQWQNEFSDRVTWLARAGGNQTAEIRLNPANLGTIEVKVVMHDQQASITFTAQHGVVRDAIEASLPRLREMFSGGGLQLANANVSDQPLHDQRQGQQQGYGWGAGSGNGDGRSQGWYGKSDEFGDLITPISLSASSPASMLPDSVDYYA